MFRIRKNARLPKAALAVVLGAALAVTGCGKKEGDKTVVATYTGGEITQTELTQFHSIFFSQYGDMTGSPEMQEYLLKQLATLKIMAGKASDDTKKEAEKEAKDQIKQMEDYYNSQEKGAFNKQLDALKVSKKDLEKYVTLSTTVLKDTSGKVTDDEIKASYDAKLKEDPHVYDLASVAHILVSLKDPNDSTKDLRTKDEALVRINEVKAKLASGGDFAALAKEYSDDPGSKDNGGKYENQNPAVWDPAFKEAAITQPVGQIGQPFESSFGYHILRVDKREVESMDAVKEDLRTEIADKMIGEFVDNELPKLEFTITLPAASAEASPAASADASASPAASVSPAASAAASASPAAK
ncbi:peptidylprolyl isomerase [Paenibacillus sp. YN15]|uniref:peptidylprolyl isomerase n=1 Tax=Paenibacillus sp. YN15 TaxID=1742774 RepID=UPI000DCDC39A|nr:peptidylprolyl isomerase [Paenibacillus sp. YN15]RAU95964.1 peptidylprolyl isomerase [Paenibacillus sp. YN15]